jgi:hypothetical protein
MAKNKIVELLDGDEWAAVKGKAENGPFVLRYRTPILAPSDTKGYGRVLKIVWAYANENTRAMPTSEESKRMAQFENRFCDAVEQDALAILTAVLTFDGARQWVFYTRDVQECGVRLNEMPQDDEPYPLELTTEQDPQWTYLREEVLRKVPVE